MMSADPQAESPFVETEAEASLRRIAEASRDRKAAKDRMARIKAEYKAAREDYAKCVEEELQIIDAETTELPLFPRLKDGGDNGNSAAKPADGAAPFDDPRSKTWLSEIGLSSAIVCKLGEAGIQTVGDVARYTATGKHLRDIAGIGPTSEELILDCLAKFWGDNPAA